MMRFWDRNGATTFRGGAEEERDIRVVILRLKTWPALPLHSAGCVLGTDGVSSRFMPELLHFRGRTAAGYGPAAPDSFQNLRGQKVL